MALDEATIERALTRVLGYVDPVAHALATKAAARDETTIAAALKNVLGPEAARAVQEARVVAGAQKKKKNLTTRLAGAAHSRVARQSVVAVERFVLSAPPSGLSLKRAQAQPCCERPCSSPPIPAPSRGFDSRSSGEPQPAGCCPEAALVLLTLDPYADGNAARCCAAPPCAV